jgi:hypothetical protein
MRLKYLLLASVMVAVATPTVATEDPAEKGLTIAKEVERRDLGFSDYTVDGTMILKSRQGEESVRHFELRTLEVEDDGDKTLSIFHEPRDVRGTAVLTYAHGRAPDDQWIYLPALKRVKRIASSNKSGPFIGSEFAFEDLGSWEVKKYTYKYLRDELLDGRNCFIVENTPAYEHSGYTRQVEWVDQEIYQPRRIDYYDRRGTLLKTLTFKDYQRYLGKHWRPDEILMENRQTGKTTRLIWNNYRFRAGMTEKDFGQNALKRVY